MSCSRDVISCSAAMHIYLDWLTNSSLACTVLFCSRRSSKMRRMFTWVTLKVLLTPSEFPISISFSPERSYMRSKSLSRSFSHRCSSSDSLKFSSFSRWKSVFIWTETTPEMSSPLADAACKSLTNLTCSSSFSPSSRLVAFCLSSLIRALFIFWIRAVFSSSMVWIWAKSSCLTRS